MPEDSANSKRELFFGLVGAAGTDLNLIENLIKDNLKIVGYNKIVGIRLSSLLQNVEVKDENGKKIELIEKPEEHRISSYMDAGNALRKDFEQGDALALLAISQINEERGKAGECEKIAYILRSLKHPDEVYALRRIYGESFFLIGVYSSHDKCIENLSGTIAKSHESANTEEYKSKAEDLYERDADEHDVLGQRVRDTYHLSDVFISLEDEGNARESVKRFISLLFGHTFYTPTKDEFSMFTAHAVAARSASLGRQVGTAIANDDGEILSVGVNDVPCFGGGLYWDDSPNDCRDHKLKIDSNYEQIKKIVDDVCGALEQKGYVKDGVAIDDVKKLLIKSKIKRITEYGRMVHSEMDAIIQASRLGISVKGANLYTTLFPCHNCAKHIVATGIKRVVYIEPYSKSLTWELHKDSIVVDTKEVNKVVVQSFVGVGPRRYLDLFLILSSVGEIKRKDDDGNVLEWNPATAEPRLGFYSRESYFSREKVALEKLYSKINK